MIKLDKVGSDPEFGIVDEFGTPLPSFMFFEGTKDEPEAMGDGFAILKDNLLVEGNIPAANSKVEFIDFMKYLKDIISIPLEVAGSKLICSDKLEYEDMWIQTPDGQEFGCSEFESAYKRGSIATPHRRDNSRELGFHIHISYDLLDKSILKTKKQFNKIIAKAMDYFVGIPSDKILYTPERRNSYGILGAMRHTTYGLEYRSLGGYFTQDKYLGWVYEQTVKAIEFCSIKENVQKLMEIKSADESNYKQLGIILEEQVPTTKLILV